MTFCPRHFVIYVIKPPKIGRKCSVFFTPLLPLCHTHKHDTPHIDLQVQVKRKRLYPRLEGFDNLEWTPTFSNTVHGLADCRWHYSPAYEASESPTISCISGLGGRGFKDRLRLTSSWDLCLSRPFKQCEKLDWRLVVSHDFLWGAKLVTLPRSLLRILHLHHSAGVTAEHFFLGLPSTAWFCVRQLCVCMFVSSRRRLQLNSTCWVLHLRWWKITTVVSASKDYHQVSVLMCMCVSAYIYLLSFLLQLFSLHFDHFWMEEDLLVLVQMTSHPQIIFSQRLKWNETILEVKQ